MKKLLSLALLSLVVFAAGCGTTPGFHTAVAANTQRSEVFLDAFLEQAANDLTAINDCYMRTPTARSAECTVMATSLRMTSTMLMAFVGKPEQTRVPASPEEIIERILTKGMKFALGAYGFDRVASVVKSGQLAQAQTASEGIAAGIKPPLVVDKPTPILIQGEAARVIPLE